ncbi:hypothetical protein [Amycolatopsis sp. FDAARGOS 1241]|uniref:hypothetical protein n=1 Tax=Amycolatopsis sp. FDAARGOS 1241 TaxID=2778070 RepID=UPI001950166C|nr:hypothetical protein [Amycolatopsis sp. FDAARGOS 1241]QRP45256.1 hypothetical protein I6J71_39830 [Amycolatopsis sp. FDAARGOS 1241]
MTFRSLSTRDDVAFSLDVDYQAGDRKRDRRTARSPLRGQRDPVRRSRTARVRPLLHLRRRLHQRVIPHDLGYLGG